MAKARRRKKQPRKRAAKPEKVVQIAAASTDEGPVLYALTEKGEIYEYGVVHDPEQGIHVGMWEGLSSIVPDNIVDEMVEEEEEEDEYDEEED